MMATSILFLLKLCLYPLQQPAAMFSEEYQVSSKWASSYWFKMLYMLYSRPIRCKIQTNGELGSKIFPRKLRALIGLSWKFWPEGITLVWSLRQSLEYALKALLT